MITLTKKHTFAITISDNINFKEQLDFTTNQLSSGIKPYFQLHIFLNHSKYLV